MRSPSASAAAALLCGLVMSCLPGGRPPEMAVRKGSKLEAKGKGAAVGGPFRISFAGPEGEEVEEPQPQLVFSRPVRALGQRGDEPKIDAKFTPEVPGRWEWMGSSAARFVPEGAFARATAYTLEVAPGIRALDGSVIGEPLTLRFSTQRPGLSNVTPEDGGTLALLDAIELWFTQPVALPALERALSVVDRAGKPLPFAASAGDKANDVVFLRPRTAWPEGERLTVRIAGGLRGAEGDLPMKPRELTLDTTPALGVASIECTTLDDGRCYNGTSVQVELNGDMRPSDLWPLIRVTPKAKLEKPDPKSDDPTAYHSIQGEFEPGVKYTVEVAASTKPPRPRAGRSGLRADELRPLRVGAQRQLVFAPPESGVSFSFSGTYLLPFSDELAAKAEETKKASVGVAALDRDLVMKVAAAKDDAFAWWDLAGVKTATLPARASDKVPPAWFSLKDLVPTKAGPVLFGARWDGFGREEKDAHVLQRSELAMLSRVSPEGALVWVTSLRTARPVEGVAVEARDAQGHRAQATTGKDGVALLSAEGLGDDKEERWLVLFAQKGDDWIFQRAEVPKRAQMKGALFTDRGLYRPGDEVSFKGVVRQPSSKGLVPLEGKQVTVEIRDPQDRRTRVPATLSPFGSFHAVFTPGLDAPLGSYRVVAEVGEQVVAQDSFKVMEYRPVSFQVESALDRKVYTRGDALQCSGRGAYLYGGSLEGSRVSASFSRQSTTYQIPGLVGYTILDAEPRRFGTQPADKTGQIDRTGKASFELRLSNDEQTGPELIRCDVTVTDPGLDAVSHASTALVHPGELYAALEEMSFRRIGPGQTLRPRVLALTPDGQRRRAKVRLSLWSYRRDPNRSWGTLPGERVASCEVTAGADPQSCALATPGGAYDPISHFVLRASLTDPGGREVSSSQRLYPGLPPRPAPPKPRRKQKPRPEAKLGADRERYERGEVAHLRAESPFAEGHLLLTVEREGVASHQVLPVGREPVQLDVPVDDATAPQVHAVATIVSPLDDHTSYRRAMEASVLLKSGWERRKLAVTLRPSKSQASPGEELDVDVDVRSSDGRPVRAEVTLYAADEATLLLASYHLPDPLDSFFDRAEHTVRGASTREHLGSLTDWKAELREFGLGKLGTLGHGAGTGTGQGFGSGHGRLGGSHTTRAPGLRADHARRDFRQTAFFLPSIPTDEEGHARAHVKLPQSLTTYRVMAFALTRSTEIGTAETPIVTSMPLQARPVVPRVIRAGDRFAVGVMAANNGATALGGKVSLEVEGLSLLGEATRPLSLGAGESRRVTFEVEARQAGKGKLAARIEGAEGLRDAAELPIEVESPLTLEAAALQGSAEGRVDEQLGDLAGARSDVGSLELTLSSSPLAGLGAGLEQLVEYPYGCTEQTVSRLVPLVALRELARALDVALPPDVDEASRGAVRRLLGNQKDDGGFGLWPGSGHSSPWLSAYAAWGLEESRRRGVPVDDKSLKRVRDHLLDLLLAWDRGAHEKAAAPFALDVLAGADDLDAPGLRSIADQLFRGREGMPLFARALLLHAMGRLGCDRADVAALASELSSGLHIDGPLARHVGGDSAYAAMFDSPVRTSALVLRALLSAAPEHPLITPLALGLVADRNGGTWRTTQETAWALLALDDYRRRRGAQPVRVEGSVLLGKSQLMAHSFAADAGAIAPDARTLLPLARIAGPPGRELSFIGQGSGPLYYQARLRFAPRELPADEVASGIEIHRRYRLVPASSDGSPPRALLTSEAPDEESFAEGAMILTQVDVVTSSLRRFVVIDDPLPGGFESVDPELQGGPRWLRSLERGPATRTERRDDRVLFFVDELPPGFHRYTHVARATAAGRFIVPPARAEEMYSPETFGRTAARVVSVR